MMKLSDVCIGAFVIKPRDTSIWMVSRMYFKNNELSGIYLCDGKNPIHTKGLIINSIESLVQVGSVDIVGQANLHLQEGMLCRFHAGLDKLKVKLVYQSIDFFRLVPTEIKSYDYVKGIQSHLVPWEYV